MTGKQCDIPGREQFDRLSVRQARDGCHAFARLWWRAQTELDALKAKMAADAAASPWAKP